MEVRFSKCAVATHWLPHNLVQIFFFLVLVHKKVWCSLSSLSIQTRVLAVTFCITLMSVKNESGQVILCLETWGRRQKEFWIGKKDKNIFFSTYPNFVFALYILISQNLHIILKKIYIPGLMSKRCPNVKNSNTFGCKSKKWNPDQNSRNTICPLGVNL